MKRLIGLMVLMVSVVFVNPARAEWSFQGLDLRMPQDVSADGSTVVGCDSDTFWWREGKLIKVADGTSGYGAAVSADGSVVVGSTGNDGVHPSRVDEAYRWSIEPRQEIEFEFLGVLEDEPVGGSHATAVSADGNVIAGFSLVGGQYEAFRWHDGNMVGLGTFGGTTSQAMGVSADGSVIVGSYYNASEERTAFRWEDGNIIDLGDLGGVDHSGKSYSAAKAISADGSVIVGDSRNVSGQYEAFSWKDGDMIGLDSFKTKLSHAYDVSADGTGVVGFYDDFDDQRHAFIWTSGEMFSIRELLVDNGVDVLGWDITMATAISDDGKTIAGYGVDPVGHARGWIATIPEPSTLILLTMGGIGVLAYGLRRRKGA